MASSLSADLAGLLGHAGWLTNPDRIEPFAVDWLGRRAASIIGVALPRNSMEAAAVVKRCSETRMLIVPQGGNTGLVGGSLPTPSQPCIILSFNRMTAIGEIDCADGWVEVDSGVTLAALNAKLADQGMWVPLRLGSEGSAQIGGLISTNAGGNQALRYGNMEAHVLGLEVVLPDGRIWSGMRRVRKDNSGYPLRRLFCGAEGTLGLVTRAVLAITPAAVNSAVAMLAVETLQGAIEVFASLRRQTGEYLSAFDFFSETGRRLIDHHVTDMVCPVASRSAYYLVVELATSLGHADLDQLLTESLEPHFGNGTIVDAVIAQGGAQRQGIWRYREEIPEAQRRRGLQIKHDVSVPLGRLTNFMEEACTTLEELVPGIVVNAFGHFGDGNIHFNLSPATDRTDFGEQDHLLSDTIYELAERAGGSFAAEHGIGRIKRIVANKFRSPEERMMMTAIKSAFDPLGLMNPGVIVAE